MTFNKSTAKRLSAFLLCAAPIIALSASVSADDGRADVPAQLRPDMKILIDGTERTFYNVSGKEVHPILYSGTTYLPVRSIGEIMGRNVGWDADTNTVTLSGYQSGDTMTGTPDTAAKKEDVTAQLRPDFSIIIDGIERTFYDANKKVVYPLLYNGSTYLPVRAISTLMGKEVGWDGASNTVTLVGEPSMTDYGPDHDGLTDYGFTDYGVTDYIDTDYGPNNDGVTDYGNTDYGPSNDGITDYGNSNYGNSNYGNSNYGNSNYGSSNYGDSDYGD